MSIANKKMFSNRDVYGYQGTLVRLSQRQAFESLNRIKKNLKVNSNAQISNSTNSYNERTLLLSSVGKTEKNGASSTHESTRSSFSSSYSLPF